MAVEGESAESLRIPSGMNLTQVTLPEGSLCHYIADNELERLGEMRKDFVMEVCLASAGIFAGSLIPAIDGFLRFSNKTNPATQTDLVSMMLAFAAFVVTIITALQWRVRSKSHVDLVTEIRGRPKVPVALVPDGFPQRLEKKTAS